MVMASTKCYVVIILILLHVAVEFSSSIKANGATAMQNQAPYLFFPYGFAVHDNNEGKIWSDSPSDFLLAFGPPMDVFKNIIPPSFIAEHRIINAFCSIFLVA